jgi:hypothetical protein
MSDENAAVWSDIERPQITLPEGQHRDAFRWRCDDVRSVLRDHHGHDYIVGSIEQFLVVARPDRCPDEGCAFSRDEVSRASVREAPDEELVAAVLPGDEDQPASVRTERGAPLVEPGHRRQLYGLASTTSGVDWHGEERCIGPYCSMTIVRPSGVTALTV